MIDTDGIKEYMTHKLVNAYIAGANAALVDIARIAHSTDDEIIEIAKSKGLDVTRWEKQ